MGIQFISDEDLDSLEYSAEGMIRLLGYLTGESINGREEEKVLLGKIVERTRSLNYQQLNEILLLLNLDRIEEGFFEFFFLPENKTEKIIDFKELCHGVKKFRGFAMLKFGNFPFAYRKLREIRNSSEIERELEPFTQNSKHLNESMKKRPKRVLEIEPIPKEKTWLLGTLSFEKYKKDEQRAKDKKDKKRQEELEQEGKSREYYITIGQRNTDIYLTWDYMDTYIATSMRERWEFKACFEFVRRLFEHGKLKELNLCYFDPTQSFTKNRIDKGLIEGLMIKRAACTVYLAQETETLGKDSELAATLAQGKPVIAYVPEKVSKEDVEEYPLQFFWKRFKQLETEQYFDEELELQSLLLEKLFPSASFKALQKALREVTDLLDKYMRMKTYNLYENKQQEELKAKNKETLDLMLNMYEVCEPYYMNKRADLLRRRHPLGIQMDLRSGVANGVLVVRSIPDCADLLFNILTNSISFSIEHTGGVVELIEKISKSPYRVVTDNMKLTNSFWNFVLFIDIGNTLWLDKSNL